MNRVNHNLSLSWLFKMILKVKKWEFLTIRELDLYDPNDKSYVMRTIGSFKRRDIVNILYKTRRF